MIVAVTVSMAVSGPSWAAAFAVTGQGHLPAGRDRPSLSQALGQYMAEVRADYCEQQRGHASQEHTSHHLKYNLKYQTIV